MALPEWIEKIEEIKNSIESRTKEKVKLEVKVKEYAGCYTYNEVKLNAKTDFLTKISRSI